MSGYGQGQGGYPFPPSIQNYNNPQPNAALYPPPQQDSSASGHSYNSSSSGGEFMPTPTSMPQQSAAYSDVYTGTQFPTPQVTPPYPQHQHQHQHQQQQHQQHQHQHQHHHQPTTSTLSSQSNSQINSDQFTVKFNEIEQDTSQTQPAPYLHVGEAPKVQPRRYKTQRVRLTEGNFVVECLVPSKLTALVPRKGDREFTHVRYTACTCDPDEFRDERYTLRQELYEEKRPTELFIVITMYNEDAVLFARTFQGVVKNIYKLCKRGRSRMWGPDGWKKVVVCVVSDGIEKIDKTTENYLSAIGAYQKGVPKKKIEDKNVTAHIFEYTTQICLDPDMKPVGELYEYTPIQVLFCLKEKNQKKINSHRWFFNAFGKALNPNVCVLLDAGTKPGGSSIYHLWKAFDVNEHIGGACGEIVAMKGKYGSNLLNPLVAAQNFEYKMSNILDKPLESVFGYITVLPGAFSAYRYRALQNSIDPVTNKEVGPLASYFMGEKHHGGGPPKKKKKVDGNNEKGGEEEVEEEEIKTGLFEANMYLAEDRILCFELISKRDSQWVLHYVKSAYAETDVPDDIIELISQRRRWLNGSFFASLYAICHTTSIWRSSHTGFKKFTLLVEMFYQAYNLFFSWFALGNLYLTFYILGNSLSQEGETIEGLWSATAGSIIFNLLKYIYIGLIILQFSLALGNKPKSAKWAYVLSTGFFAFLMFYMLFAAGWVTYKGVRVSLSTKGPLDVNVSSASKILSDVTFVNVVISLLSTYGLYFIASFLFAEPYHMFHSSIQYLLLVPFYVNVLNVYAFCNIHDVSWGTKGDTKAPDQQSTVKKEQTTEGQETIVKAELPDDIDDEYERVQEALIPKGPEPKGIKDLPAKELKILQKDKNLSKEDSDKIQERLKELQTESNAMFRTYLVFCWMISNGILIGIITNFSPSLDSFKKSEERSITYFAVVLWSVAALAAFRFIGSCLYLLFRLFTENIFDGLIK